jgi:hypothetical protein
MTQVKFQLLHFYTSTSMRLVTVRRTGGLENQGSIQEIAKILVLSTEHRHSLGPMQHHIQRLWGNCGVKLTTNLHSVSGLRASIPAHDALPIK